MKIYEVTVPIPPLVEAVMRGCGENAEMAVQPSTSGASFDTSYFIECFKVRHLIKLKAQVLPRIKLGLLDSKSRVLIITPQDLTYSRRHIARVIKKIYGLKCFCRSFNSGNSTCWEYLCTYNQLV